MQWKQAVRVVTLLLSLVMLAMSLPLSAFATEEKSAEVEEKITHSLPCAETDTPKSTDNPHNKSHSPKKRKK